MPCRDLDFLTGFRIAGCPLGTPTTGKSADAKKLNCLAG